MMDPFSNNSCEGVTAQRHFERTRNRQQTQRMDVILLDAGAIESPGVREFCTGILPSLKERGLTLSILPATARRVFREGEETACRQLLGAVQTGAAKIITDNAPEDTPETDAVVAYCIENRHAPDGHNQKIMVISGEEDAIPQYLGINAQRSQRGGIVIVKTLSETGLLCQPDCLTERAAVQEPMLDTLLPLDRIPAEGDTVWDAERSVSFRLAGRLGGGGEADLLVSGYSKLEDHSLPAARQTLLRRIKRALDRTARAVGCPVRQLASTLVAAAVDETAHTLLTVHLGDGFILGLRADGRVDSMSRAENGRFCNETWFTTSRAAARHLRLNWYDLKAENFVAVGLSSDGLQFCRSDGAPLPGLEATLTSLAVMHPAAAQIYLEQMLESEAQYSDDDLSFACLTDRDACFRLAPVVRPGGTVLTPGCLRLLHLLQAEETCTNARAARRLHTCPRRVRIWRQKLQELLLIL